MLSLLIDTEEPREGAHGGQGDHFREGGLTAHGQGQVGLGEHRGLLRRQERCRKAPGDARVHERGPEGPGPGGGRQSDHRV